MHLSFIIRSFNEERHIGRLLDGIERQELPNDWCCEVIVVDSGSTDSTVSIASHMGAKIIHIPQNEFSFGRALNMGCAVAEGDILIFASAHVYPLYKDWIYKMVLPFKDQNVGLVYGRQTGNEFSHFSELQIFDKWFPMASNYHQNSPFCNNANCAIRKSLWSAFPYDEQLTGLEDLDWAKQILSKGYKIVYEAEATIVHVHEETPSKIKNRYRREAIAMKQIMPEVSFNYFDFIRLFVSNSLNDLFHALRMNVLFSEFKNIITFRYMQFYGTYLGHRQKGNISKDLKNRFYYPNGITKTSINKDDKDRNASRLINYS